MRLEVLLCVSKVNKGCHFIVHTTPSSARSSQTGFFRVAKDSHTHTHTHTHSHMHTHHALTWACFTLLEPRVARLVTSRARPSLRTRHTATRHIWCEAGKRTFCVVPGLELLYRVQKRDVGLPIFFVNSFGRGCGKGGGYRAPCLSCKGICIGAGCPSGSPPPPRRRVGSGNFLWEDVAGDQRRENLPKSDSTGGCRLF